MKHVKRIIPFVILVICLFLCSSSCGEATAEISDVSAQVGIINSATITVNKMTGTYDICFGDADGKWLKEYTKITTLETTGGNDSVTIENLVVPPNAKTLVLVDDGGNQHFFDESIKIPEECTNLGEMELLFGAISDVHFNRYYSKPQKDDAKTSFQLALDYFDSVDVDLVAIAGDLSKDAEQVSFMRYDYMISSLDYEVLTCTGNHDVPSIESGDWQTYVTNDILALEGTSDVAPNGIDFVYSENEGDVFVFLNQVYWDYNKEDSRLLENEQLVWLREVFEKYKNDRVYLFFHTFLCGPDGEKHTGVGNIKNPGGYTYDLPYTYGTEDEIEFRSILKEYKNVIYFSGHSHWQFEMEVYGENANFSSFDDEYGYMVHIPSVTEPRYIGENDTSRTGMNGKSSQGWLISVYEECIILLPIEFTTGTIYTEYIEIISYR